MTKEEVVTKMVETNSPKNNLGKLTEECAELLEVLIKLTTKTEDNKPKREKIVEELGDLTFRMEVYIRQNGMNQEVADRVAKKVKQVEAYINSDQYVGGV